MRRKVLSYLLVLTGIASLLCGSFLVYHLIQEEYDVRKRADEALEILVELIPPRVQGKLYEDDTEEMGCLEINHLNFVGYVQIGDVYAFAVQNEYGSVYAPRMKGGIISNGTGVIVTDIMDMDLIPVGTPVIFTDVNGMEYAFLVDYIGDGDEVLRNAKLIIISEGMTDIKQIGCIEE